MMAANHHGSPRLYDDHPSLSASLEDFEQSPRSPMFGLPSQHSGFKSEQSESEDEPTSDLSGEPWSPPAWRQQAAAGGWYHNQPYSRDKSHLKASVSASRSRGTSPRYESAQEDEGDITLAAKIPLPRGSVSPVKERSPSVSPEKGQVSPTSSPTHECEKNLDEQPEDLGEGIALPGNSNNCEL